MKAVYNEYSAKRVHFIFINGNSNEPPAEVAGHGQAHGFPFPVYRDVNGTAADLFGAELTPETYVIDEDRVIRYHGCIDDSVTAARNRGLRLALDAVLAGKTLPMAENEGVRMHRQAPQSFVKSGALVWALAACFGAEPRLTGVDEISYPKLLEAQRGKIVLVDFWATWCDPCREQLPRLAAYEAKLRGRGFVLITISADDPEQDAAAYAFLLKSGVRLPGYRKQTENDSAFIDFIDRKWSGALPALFLYGRDGAKVKSFIGETEMDEIEQAVGKLL